MSADQGSKLAEALVAFQKNLPSVHKGSTGQVPGNRTYKYADLADVTAAVLPALAEHGLSWMAMPAYTESGHFVLRYELLHVSGESRTGEYPLPDGDPQKIGSALTYGRRYCLCSTTGVVADEDDDGVAAAGTTPARRQGQQQRNGHQNGNGQPQGGQRDDPIERAKAHLRELIAARKLDGTEIANRYAEQYGENLREAVDANRITAFTKLIEAEPAGAPS